MSSCTLRASFDAECASQVSVVTSNRASRCAMDASVVGANADGAARMVDARSRVKRDSSLRARQLRTHLKNYALLQRLNSRRGLCVHADVDAIALVAASITRSSSRWVRLMPSSSRI